MCTEIALYFTTLGRIKQNKTEKQYRLPADHDKNYWLLIGQN